MFDACKLGKVGFAPARFCAPLAGYTHSAFRRVVAEWGGTGAFWTEMLAARQILSEDFTRSPWLRRRPIEGPVIFQLMTRAGDPLDRILARLAEQGVTGLDLNLACDAKPIRARQAGSALFEDLAALRMVTEAARRQWPGLLTAKIRLGSRRPDWRARFQERLRTLEQAGFDAVILHPRFFEDKFRRLAQHDLLAWVTSLTRLPVIANGDLEGPESIRQLEVQLAPAAGIMIGRMAVVRPWIFSGWDQSIAIDYAAVWRRMHDAILDDFDAPVALRRIQMFTKYYAANFQFGHRFRTDIGNAQSLEAVRERAETFFSRPPALVARPTVAGL
jgi:tRNA-dihydrouridine synthase